MTRRQRVAVLYASAAIMVLITALLPRVAQSESYHRFADTRAFAGIPNCLNVLSNIPFLIVGIMGVFALRRDGAAAVPLADPRERWPWLLFFVGFALVAFGSAWYHWRPDDSSLVWDRIPMTIAFMSLVAALVSERVNLTAGLILLAPLVAFGIATVAYWSATQARGYGDLRPYGLVQFGSVAMIVLLIALFPPRYTGTVEWVPAISLLVLSKIFEAADRPVFSAGRVVSGHTLKHILAALSAWWILRMLRRRRPIAAAPEPPAPSMLKSRRGEA